MVTRSGDAARLRSTVDAVLAGVDRLQRVATTIWERIEVEVELTQVQAQALGAIAGGARTVSAVADACGRHVSSASRIVDSLVQRSFVDREEDAEDRRAVRLDVTPAGAAALEEVLTVHRDRLEQSLAQLDERDAAELARLLTLLAQAAERTAGV